ncbi:MAG: type I secretion system permease/ATPase [Deltaproteobacteria bacterium]
MKKFLLKFSNYFLYVGLFSLVSNLLQLAPSLYMLQVYDRVINSRSVETLVMLTILLAALLLTALGLDVVRSRLLVGINAKLDDMISEDILRGMIGLDGAQIGKTYPYGLKDMGIIRTFLTGTGIFAIFDAPWFPIYMLILYYMHPVLFSVAFFGAIVMITLAILNEKISREPLKDANKYGRDASRYVDISLRNREAINAMGMFKGVLKHWGKYNSLSIGYQTLASKKAGLLTNMSKFARQFLQSSMLGVGAYLVLKNEATGGIMIAGSIIAGKALSPIDLAISGWKNFVEARQAYRRLSEFMDTINTTKAEQMDLLAPKGHVVFENVYFNIGQRSVIKAMSFALQPGETLGIIGPSAAGKSTVARLMVGVYKPTVGAVRLDGADISQWQKDKIGQYIGYLPQDIELFPGTVAENIARLQEVDSQKVIQAAMIAGCHEMILRLPNGYDTDIGETGTILSGGQRQRIGIARAFYGLPKLIVMDEPNSNLDTEGEQALLNAILIAKKAKLTTVVISHKLNILSIVDKILLVTDGAVKLYGPRNEVFKQLVPQQSQSRIHAGGAGGSPIIQ